MCLVNYSTKTLALVSVAFGFGPGMLLFLVIMFKTGMC